MERSREGQETMIKELQGEIKSLKNLLLNRRVTTPGTEAPGVGTSALGKPSIPTWQLESKKVEADGKEFKKPDSDKEAVNVKEILKDEAQQQELETRIDSSVSISVGEGSTKEALKIPANVKKETISIPAWQLKAMDAQKGVDEKAQSVKDVSDGSSVNDAL